MGIDSHGNNGHSRSHAGCFPFFPIPIPHCVTNSHSHGNPMGSHSHGHLYFKVPARNAYPHTTRHRGPLNCPNNHVFLPRTHKHSVCTVRIKTLKKTLCPLAQKGHNRTYNCPLTRAQLSLGLADRTHGATCVHNCPSMMFRTCCCLRPKCKRSYLLIYITSDTS